MPSTAEPTRVDEARALDVLADDGLVAFPTETVWGLAARAESPRAVNRLRAFKGRDADHPIAVIVDRPERLRALDVELGEFGERLVETFWPGPLTIVARCRHRFAPGVNGADGSVGLRCSSHPVAAAIAGGALDRGLGPVTATSLNRSGEEPARSVSEAMRVAASAPSVVVALGEAGGREASTVVDVTGATPRVLREGAILASAVYEVRASETVSR